MYRFSLATFIKLFKKSLDSPIKHDTPNQKMEYSTTNL